MHIIARCACISTLFLLLGCETGTPANDIAAEVERDAERFIAELKAGRWHVAATLCVVDEYARRAFALAESEDEKVVLGKIAATFQRLYEKTPPGEIYGVDVDPYKKGDAGYARVVYIHDDLDAFNMRKVENHWRYTYE